MNVLKEFALSLNEKTKHHWISYFQIALTIFYDETIKYYVWRFWYMITF